MIGGFKRRAANFVQARRDARTSPQQLLAGDVYIVEFPKSGVTWLTMLLANAFAVEYEWKEKVTFASVRRFIPDLHASCAVAPRLTPGGLAFYKSHAKFNRNYVTTIYLARHPLAVMRSYHKFCAALDPSTPDKFDIFLDDPRLGLAAWKQHVRSWIGTPRDSSQRQFHLLRYEDLVADTVAALIDLNNNLGLGLSKTSISEAVSRSERRVMKAQEEFYRRYNPNHQLDFIGKGEKQANGDAVVKKVIRHCAEELNWLGYEIEKEWQPSRP